MKRHKSLHPLSHDHHHALVQARKLRNASSDASLPSIRQTASDFIAFWNSSLQAHFRQEEQILLPMLLKYTSADRRESIETLRQHDEIQRTVRELCEEIEAGKEPDAEKLVQVGRLLDEHIRYEERQLFAAIEQEVPEEELWEMNRQLTGK
jgi:hemerythrin-like domain-containing protein